MPAGTRHSWWNDQPGEALELIFTIAPRCNYEHFFRTVYGERQATRFRSLLTDCDGVHIESPKWNPCQLWRGPTTSI